MTGTVLALFSLKGCRLGHSQGSMWLIEVFWNAKCALKWASLLDPLEGKVIVGINPGGDRANRRWSPDRFAAVAEAVIGQFNAVVILLGGPAEVPIASHIADRIGSGAINLAGKTSVDALPYIISRMDLLITNDSGPMHIAAATKTPLVALFGPEDPRLFGPYAASNLYRVVYKPMNCRPCNKSHCALPTCLDQIMPEEVYRYCIEMLQGRAMTFYKG
jgi:heptosyltransferase-2